MKPIFTTKEFNASGNPNFRYKVSSATNVADTIKRWMRDYNRAWDEAIEENKAWNANHTYGKPLRYITSKVYTK